jgi:glycosyltransferase involved in cell wall biosynthesis
MSRPAIVQFNLSPTLGGAEVYTAFFTRALVQLGWPTRLVVDPAARFWNDLDLGGAERTASDSGRHFVEEGEVALIHSSLPERHLGELDGCHVIGLAHQTLYDATRPGYYDRADMLLAVSQHVIDSLRQHGIDRVYPQPLYGVADLSRGEPSRAIRQGHLFDPDARKPRDRLLAAFARARAAFAAPQRLEQRSGLSLGVVSRLAPLKQFPELFERLVPILLRHPRVNIDIFGAAVGYKSLAAMRSVVAPLGVRARFWGHQRDVRQAYGAIDYLLTGLPEREALGLNAIEAYAAGTPVLAVDAPPFTETLSEGVTGFFYADPRRDGGADFERVLSGIEDGALRPRMDAATGHLARFSASRFAQRVEQALQHAVAGRRI